MWRLGGFGLEAEFARPTSSSAYRKSPACFASSARHEVLVGGKKIAAAAQRRVRGGLLIHGSLIFSIRRPLWARIFGEGAVERTGEVMESIHVPRRAFRDAFIEKAAEALGAEFRVSKLGGLEAGLRDRLMEERYLRKGWNEGAEGARPGQGRDALSDMSGVL